jgi:hypothetical protein
MPEAQRKYRQAQARRFPISAVLKTLGSLLGDRVSTSLAVREHHDRKHHAPVGSPSRTDRQGVPRPGCR